MYICIYVYIRQRDSYELAQEHYKLSASIESSPDMAFMLGAIRPCYENKVLVYYYYDMICFYFYSLFYDLFNCLHCI